MSSIKSLVVPVIFAIVIVFSLSSVKGEDVNEQRHLCNPKVNADESKEEENISFLIAMLIDGTPTNGYSQHLNFNGYYGVAACNGQISKDECTDCLDFANNVIYKLCGFCNGAQINLADCRLRFEGYEIADWTAIDPNIFNIIAGSGTDAQLSLSEIASWIPMDNPKSLAVLEYILRLLSVTSFLSGSSRPSLSSGQPVREMTYGLSKQLRILLGHKTGTPSSAFVMLGTDREICERFYALKHVIFEPKKSSFGGEEGKNLFRVAESNPRFGGLFNAAMSVSSHHVVNEVIQAYQGFDQLTELMDVAGSVGIELTHIVSADGINFDLPSVIAQAPKHPGIKHIGGDMFQTLPKAQNIWMKWTFHDLDDVMCEKLPRKCWEPLPEDGRVTIVEFVVPDDPEDKYKSLDAVLTELHMIVFNLRGKERTRTQFENLTMVTGLAEINFVPINHGFFLIEFFENRRCNNAAESDPYTM